jgi:hypothetical protein
MNESAGFRHFTMMIVWFADIGGVVDYYYLSFLFIIIIKDCIFYLSTFNLENDQILEQLQCYFMPCSNKYIMLETPTIYTGDSIYIWRMDLIV